MAGLRELAQSDLGAILRDTDYGFGWPISVTDTDGLKKPLVGFSNDISQLIDPDTGQAVSGRLATVALHIGDLTEAGLGLPQGIADAKQKPWIIEFNDIHGEAYSFKVAQSNPDRAIGVVTCILELYAK